MVAHMSSCDDADLTRPSGHQNASCRLLMSWCGFGQLIVVMSNESERQRDLSQATQEEALEAFSTAQEPIIVQVARQRPTASGSVVGPSWQSAPVKDSPPPTKPLPAPPTLENATITKPLPLHHHRRLRCLASAPLPESETAQQRRQHLQHLDRPGFRQPLCLSSSSQDLILGDAVEQLYQLADRGDVRL
uniref:Uncharacterized protein n=1 Tax=Macrostomum lignano TaxID=282301 RepID=A0A1I8JP76_9PLAT